MAPNPTIAWSFTEKEKKKKKKMPNIALGDGKATREK